MLGEFWGEIYFICLEKKNLHRRKVVSLTLKTDWIWIWGKEELHLGQRHNMKKGTHVWCAEHLFIKHSVVRSCQGRMTEGLADPAIGTLKYWVRRRTDTQRWRLSLAALEPGTYLAWPEMVRNIWVSFENQISQNNPDSCLLLKLWKTWQHRDYFLGIVFGWS